MNFKLNFLYNDKARDNCNVLLGHLIILIKYNNAARNKCANDRNI